MDILNWNYKIYITFSLLLYLVVNKLKLIQITIYLWIENILSILD